MELFEQITQNTTIITPNRRLSATLLKRYHQYQIAKGKVTWQTLDCLPLQSWILRLWDEIQSEQMDSNALILSQQQEQVLWENILKNSPTNDTLLQLSATAELAKSAWSILKQWRVDFTHPLLDMTEDSRAFQQWAEQFHLLCSQNNWLDTNSLIDKVIERIKCKQLSLPDKLIVTGFTEKTPLQEYLLANCADAGVRIHYHSHECPQRSERFISLADEETEIYTMARWSKTLLTTQPSITIGCVIPNLENIRDRVIQIFAESLGENHSYSLDHGHLPFNISAGKSLSLYPIIHAAFRCLNLQNEKISLEVFSSLLRSPFIGEAEREFIPRANFDSRLRNANMAFFSINTLLDRQDKLQLGKYCPSLNKRLTKFLTHLQTLPTLQAISAWVDQFMLLLDILGWPGERSINSHEYQIVQRWLDLMVEYRTFDTILPKQNYQDALYHLSRLATKAIFQPQSSDAPIQILGMLEAAELPFDHLWVMGLDDTAWPASAKPNPFITQRLQKSLHMPHATAERELMYSAQLTEQLRKSSKNVIFSHAAQKGDCELRPSSLISHFKELQFDELQLHEYYSASRTIFQSQKLESLQDESAPPILPNEKIRGGVSIFKQQAACPFKAFAEIRLHARPLESPSIGLRSQDRGTIAHKALELTWKEIQDSERLSNFDDTDIRLLLDHCVKEALESIIDESIVKTRYLALETERLKSLLWNWLQLERSRPPFKVISQEQEQTILIGQIPVTLRVDRVDELHDGSHLIIDYKTGKNIHIKHWFSERPDEPQLPLYCITYPKNTTSIAFAAIHPDSMTLQGISKNNLNIKDIKLLSETHYAAHKDWDQQILAWQITLENIGNEFHQGNARVSPKDSDETCRYCDLQALCRIHEDQ